MANHEVEILDHLDVLHDDLDVDYLLEEVHFLFPLFQFFQLLVGYFSKDIAFAE